jgi:hypothetical protein
MDWLGKIGRPARLPDVGRPAGGSADNPHLMTVDSVTVFCRQAVSSGHA